MVIVHFNQKIKLKIMKNAKVFFLALTLIPFLLSSCNREEIEVPSIERTLAPGEVALTVEAMVANTLEGSQSAAKSADEYQLSGSQPELECGASIDTTLTIDTVFTDPQGNEAASFQYTTGQVLTLVCDDHNLPQSLNLTSEASGSYDGVKMYGEETGSGQFSISGLLPNNTQYEVDGTYSATGSATTTQGQQATYTLEMSLEISDLVLDKETFEPESGQGTFVLTATGQNGKTYTFNGSILINADGTVTITINGKEFVLEI